MSGPGPSSIRRDGEIPAAELRDVSKTFYGTAANSHVDLAFYRGEVHALLGENGAGKSTTCSILSGLYHPDAGEVRVDGEPVRLHSPHHALEHGIGMVYQHFRLVRSLTVAENVVLGRPDTPRVLRHRDLERMVGEQIERLGFDLNPGSRVGQLSVGEQQRVEILRLLARDVRILILDEPTAVLAPNEVQVLFDAVRAMAARDLAVVLVSHKMSEVLEHTDRVSVLRQGVVTARVQTAETTAAELAQAMMGRAVSLPQRARTEPSSETVLTVDNLRVEGADGTQRVNGLSLRVRRGEVLGIAGVAGNGQTELADAIAGLRRVRVGSIAVGPDGVDVTHRSVSYRVEQGLAYIPEDRLGTGVAGGLTVDENAVLRAFNRPPYARRGLLSPSSIKRAGEAVSTEFDVRRRSRSEPIRWLSGGNIQKTIIGRELRSNARILVACSPTRGLDLGAVASVRRFIADAVARDVGVLLISEDLDELVALSDRLTVMYRGTLNGEFAPDQVDPETLGLLMTGKSRE